LPTSGTKVPSGNDWLHEIKHDGYRLIVQRDGKRVRLFTKNWTKRYPWIVETALRMKQQQFTIDGEAVVLGVDAGPGAHEDDERSDYTEPAANGVQPMNQPVLLLHIA
jgi:ATP-dependent DNA ligase